MKKEKTLGIFTNGIASIGHWDPDSIRSGITGSEEAVIYMSKELANLGFKVLVYGNPKPGSIYSKPNANPRYVGDSFRIKEPLDIAIAWRSPEMGTFLKEKNVGKKVFFWPHDTATSSTVSTRGLDGVLWLSKWQRAHWSEVEPSFGRFTEIFGNGIETHQFKKIQERKNPYSCIYGSNYARGLEILLAIWPEVKRHFPKAVLDIYYGWKHWGLLVPEKERWMREKISELSDVHDHGMVGHTALNEAYNRASFWTYPCIMPETFCITALRAQLSGAIPVILEGTALSETVRYGARCHRLQDYLPTLLRAMERAESISLKEREEMGAFIVREFTWKKLAERWKDYFLSYT